MDYSNKKDQVLNENVKLIGLVKDLQKNFSKMTNQEISFSDALQIVETNQLLYGIDEITHSLIRIEKAVNDIKKRDEVLGQIRKSLVGNQTILYSMKRFLEKN